MAGSQRLRLWISVLIVAWAARQGGGAQAAGRCVLRDFSKSGDPHRHKWSTATSGGKALGLTSIDRAHGESLEVKVAFPRVSEAWRRAPLTAYSRVTRKPALVPATMQYDVYVPRKGLPRGIRVQARLLLKTKDGHWFEALGRRLAPMPTGESIWEPATALHPGWNTIRVDLSEDSVDLRPRGHEMRWSRFLLSQVRGVGFSFQGDRSFTGRLAVDNIATWLAADAAFAEPLRIVDFEPGATSIPQYGCAEITFRVNRPVLNPFHAGEISIDAEFRRQGGQAVRVPAYYYQAYRRVRGVDDWGDGDPDAYIPIGPGVYKVRFTPREAGTYAYRLHVRYRSPISGLEQTLVSEPRSLSVTPHASRGFVRIARKDPDYFEFENGEFFFPVGHSFRSPSDPRHVRMILRRYFALFQPEELVDEGALLRGLGKAASAPAGSLSRRIWDALPSSVQSMVEAANDSTPLPAGHRQALVAALNQIVQGSGVFQQQDYQAWDHVWEIGDTLDHTKRRIDTTQLKYQWPQRRNRALVELTFPGAFRRTVTADRGLRTYEEILPRMHKAGVNSFEVWMCSWWLGLEWTGEWKNYLGVGRYNQENAWKLDRLLGLADKYDMYVHLTIDNHGKAGQSPQYDHEWDGSPYNRRNRADGGFLDRSTDLFSDRNARDFYRDKLRYIAARYGWSPRIYGWEMWSELDLIGFRRGRHRDVYGSYSVRSWHQEMSKYLRQMDHGKHLITTHYSGDWTVIDRGMVAQPFIDYITCDAYHDPHQTLLDMLMATDDFSQQYGKPFLVTEFGGFAYAAPMKSMEGDLYGGLWWSWMSRTAGVPLYWWFELINQEDYYKAYAALARFIAGEDKRRDRSANERPLRTGSLLWRGPGKKPNPREARHAPWNPWRRKGWPVDLGPKVEGQERTLSALLLGDGEVFYAYVYDHKQLHFMPRDESARRRHQGACLTILDIPDSAYAVADGVYRVEIWDCWNGTVIDTRTLLPQENGNLRIELPPFVAHVALKIKPEGRERDAPGEFRKPARSPEEEGTPAPSTTTGPQRGKRE